MLLLLMNVEMQNVATMIKIIGHLLEAIIAEIDIIVMAVAIKRIISSLACSALPLLSLIAYV